MFTGVCVAGGKGLLSRVARTPPARAEGGVSLPGKQDGTAKEAVSVVKCVALPQNELGGFNEMQTLAGEVSSKFTVSRDNWHRMQLRLCVKW